MSELYFKSKNIKVYPAVKRSQDNDYASNLTMEQNITDVFKDICERPYATFVPSYNSSVTFSDNTIHLNGYFIILGYVINLNNVGIPLPDLDVSNTFGVYLKLNVADIAFKSSTQANSLISEIEHKGYDNTFKDYVEDPTVTAETFPLGVYYKFERGKYQVATSYLLGDKYYVLKQPHYEGFSIVITDNEVSPTNSAALKVATLKYNSTGNVWELTPVSKGISMNNMGIDAYTLNGLSRHIGGMTNSSGYVFSIEEWLKNGFIVDDGNIS